MFLASKCLLLIAAAGLLPAAPLRVCADPNNLPQSNSRGQGFENELARMVARDLGRPLVYHWEPQRGGYLRKGLRAGKCDLMMGITSGMDRVLTTGPYYRSSYAFIVAPGRPAIHSFDDAALRKARIGLHVLQREVATVPPAQVLIHRGLMLNLVWYKLYPDFSRQNPPSALIEAVERGEVDVAVVWGPLAGYFARRGHQPLQVVPVPNQVERSVQLAFDISMAVGPENRLLLGELNTEIERRRPEIRRLLQKYGVPLVKAEAATVSVKR